MFNKIKFTHYCNLIVTLFLFFFAFAAQGQIKMEKIAHAKLPKTIKYQGKIKHAISFADRLGKHIVILSATGIYKSKAEDEKNAELFAYHFITKNSGATSIWKLHDLVQDCSLDVVAKFLENTLQVTDLNKDGVAEIWMVYRLACTGDVSPNEMKLIMYQGKQKYAMRGHSKVQIGDKQFQGGDYKFDNAFVAGPLVFKTFAKNLWNKNLMQTY